MVKTVPQLYRYIYDRAERATEAGAFRNWVSRYPAANLRSLIEEKRPNVVVCTHAFPCGVMAAYKNAFDPSLPVVGIVTDFVVHPFWIYRNVEAYSVATAEMRAVLMARGVPGERIVVSGIPVDRRFTEPRLAKPALRRALELPVDRNIVLMMGGGLGIGPIELMMRGLADVQWRSPESSSWAATPTSSDARARGSGAHRVSAAGARLRRQCFRLYARIRRAALKAGRVDFLGSAGCRFADDFVRPLPGQEERNTRYLVSRRAAIRARGPRGLAAAVGNLLSSPRRRGPTAPQHARPSSSRGCRGRRGADSEPRSRSNLGPIPASRSFLSEYVVAHQSQRAPGYAPSSRFVFEKNSARNPEMTEARRALSNNHSRCGVH